MANGTSVWRGCLLACVVAASASLAGAETPFRVDGRVPTLLWGVSSLVAEDEFVKIRQAGFNIVYTGNVATDSESRAQAYMDAAARHGLRVLLPLYLFVKDRTTGTFTRIPKEPFLDVPGATRFVERWKNHPATWGYLLVDEPELHGITKAFQREMYSFLKGLDSQKLAVSAFSFNTSEEKIRSSFDDGAFDVMEFHWYLDVTTATTPEQWERDARRRVRLLEKYRTRRFPIIVTLQTFEWKSGRFNSPVGKLARYAELFRRLGIGDGFGAWAYWTGRDDDLRKNPQLFEEAATLFRKLERGDF
jgi:hypothetical protein